MAKLKRRSWVPEDVETYIQSLAADLESRLSLGYPGDKYELGLEAIEKIEVIARVLEAGEAPETVAPDASALKRRFSTLRFIRG